MKFEKPKMETVTFDAEDVIVTSGGGKACPPEWIHAGGWDPVRCPSAGTFCMCNSK